MNVNMMNIMKYDTNKRWVIHNLNQQEMGNHNFLKTFTLKKRGNPYLTPKEI
jgi:hypothetical protein